MTRGRKRTPSNITQLRGNPGKRPVNQNEPKHSPKAPNPPTWLSREAAAEWRRVVPELDRVGTLAKVDRAALATYCEVWSTFVLAQAEVKEHGLTIMEETARSRDGEIIYVKPSKNPAVLIARDAAVQIRSFASEFGLTPSARTRIEVSAPAAGDPFDRLLS